MTGCTLCDLPVPAEPITDPDVDGEFCCHGCLEVARSLDDVEDIESVDPETAFDSADPDDVDGEVSYLSVDGMHCATCERYLESTAAGHEGVEGAAASYATNTMKVVYDPDEVTESTLPDVVTGAGYRAHERDADEEADTESQTITYLIVGGFFGMMTMLMYILFIYPQHFGFPPVVEFEFFGRLYLLGQIWLFSSIVLFYTGFPLLRGAYVSLSAGQPNMDLLVALAASSAYVYSTAVTLAGSIDVYFDVTVAIIFVVTAGNYYEDRVRERAVSLLSELTAESVSQARTRDGETVPVETVAPGTELLVRPGERVPLDGTVTEGVAAVDEALVTGESLPVTKRPGDEVVGGGVVTDAPLIVEVGEGGDSTLDRIVDMLWDIQSTRPDMQRLADKLATIFVPLVTTIAVIVAGATLLLGGSFTSAILVGLTVLIVSCPCALGLATPLAVAVGTQRAASQGIVVASETVFESLPEVETVALDKTGTLTSGSMTITDTVADDEAAVLTRAAALERYSDHPIADAIVEYTAATLDVDPADRAQVGMGPDASATDGGVQTPEEAPPVAVEPTGVVGRVEGSETVVGHPDLLEERGLDISETYLERADEAFATGGVPVMVGWDGACRGLIVVSDEPRDEWEETIEALAAPGREIVVITGDESEAAEQFAEHPDVAEVFSGVPPDGKAAAVTGLAEGSTVAMVGDGANDAPALAAADVGIAIAQQTKLAADAADAVVTSGQLSRVPELFDVSSTTRWRIRQNLGWAFLYNLVAIPLAATGLLNPLFAALAMATSSILVVLNSSRGF
jgi:Cu2+-exporting ATPase